MLLFCIIFLCCGCGKSPEEEMIGYWMRSDGYAISFVDESTCSLGGDSLYNYKIYDKNHLQASNDSEVIEFVFNVDGDTLNLGLVNEEGLTEFTKNTEKQKQILEEVREQESLALEAELLQAEIDAIKEEIKGYKADIETLEWDIDWNNKAIETNEADIKVWLDNIEMAKTQCQEAIEFGDDPEYCEKQRDEFIEVYNESIDSCNERIAELEANNAEYKKSIESIESEIEKLEAKIEKLENK